MDIDTTKSSNAERIAQPDVMETPVNTSQPTNNSHSHVDDAEKSTQPSAVSDVSQSSLLQIPEAKVEMPLLIPQKGKVSTKISLPSMRFFVDAKLGA